MRIILSVLSFFFYSVSLSQTLPESSIQGIAKIINRKIRGHEEEGGIIARGCFAHGRTLVYEYDTPKNWHSPKSLKKYLLKSYEEDNSHELFFNNDINIDFLFFCCGKLKKKISIKSYEFFNPDHGLGNYISIKSFPKAKGVNMKIRPPIGWKIQDSNFPTVVKEFIYGKNRYMIIIRNNNVFVSKNEAKTLLNDKDLVKKIITGLKSSFITSKVLNYKVVSVDLYPALEVTIKGKIEQLGDTTNLIMKTWRIFYEDKVVSLESGSVEEKEFNKIEYVYDLITDSVIFPEQFTY